MYAIVRTGGKQYRVKAGDKLRVEKLDKKLGDEFEIPEVLWIGGPDSFSGDPTISNAKVIAVVTHQTKAAKILVFKKKRRQGYRRMQGHRQWYTELFIKSITTPNGETSKAENDVKVYDEAYKAKMKEERSKVEEKTESADKKSAKKVTKKPAAKKAATKKKTKKKAVKKKTKKKVTKKKTAAKKKAKKKV